MISNYDEQIKFLELIKNIMSKIKDEIPHLESWTEAKGYLDGSIMVLKDMSQLLPPNLYNDTIKYLEAEKGLTNAMIYNLRQKGLL